MPKGNPGHPKKVKTTAMQKKAVDGIISGEHKSFNKSMRAAGYSAKVAKLPGKKLLDRKGTQQYLQRLDKKARKKWNQSVEDKVLDVYLDGLEATKLVGKNAVEHPDHPARKTFADRCAKFFGWIQPRSEQAGPTAQFNFFSVAEDQRLKFNEGLKKLLRQSH